MRMPLPDHLVEMAQRLASGEETPAEPRDAATVMLMRPGPHGPEVCLLTRHAQMAFAPGMAVFPGGGVDPRDAEGGFEWIGPSPEEWASRLGTDTDLARTLVCAAVRETFEEVGVLLAGPGADEVVDDVTGDDWEADRVALVNHEISLSSMLQRRGLALRTDLLGTWAGWLTPAFEPRRYRTWFFTAELPLGQRARDVSTEAVAMSWRIASEVVEAVEAGTFLMLPPTYLSCLDAAAYPTLEDLMVEAHTRKIEMFTPEVTQEGDNWTLSTPPRYAAMLAERERNRG